MSTPPRRKATKTRSYPESWIYMILWRIYPKAGLKAKLNSTTMAMFVLHIPPINAIQSISKSEPLQTFENFEGGLINTLKKTRFWLAGTMSKLVDIYKRQVTDKLTTSSKLVDIYKRQVTDKLTTSFHPSLRDKEATWIPLIQQADGEPRLFLNRPQQV